MKSQNWKHYFREQKQDVIIFGSGDVGALIAQYCQSNSIVIACFCDNNKSLIGTYKKGILIRSLAEIKTIYQNPMFIISLIEQNPKKAIAKQLESAGYRDYVFAKDFMEALYQYDIANDEKEKKYRKPVDCTDYEHTDSEMVYTRFLDLSITEKCSLRCRDCAHFMAYFEQPQHIQKEVLFSYIDRIDEVFDIVQTLTILGGESLLHPDFYEIVAYAQTKKSIHSIKVITNGTISINKEKMNLIQKDKIEFSISDYGALSIKLQEIMTDCKGLGILCYSVKAQEWSDSCNIDKQNRTIPELKGIYAWCHSKKCHILVDGKLFHCAFLSNTYRLRAIPRSASAYVDIMDTEKSISELKKEVKHHLYGIEYMNGCDYCYGRTFVELSAIPVAVQTKEVLSYKKYIE